MRMEVISNRGPASMASQLSSLLPSVSWVDIASAFVTPSALNIIEDVLGKTEKAIIKPVIWIVFGGLHQRFTPPAALDRMATLQKRYQSRFMARLATNQIFHWKLSSFVKNPQGFIS